MFNEKILPTKKIVLKERIVSNDISNSKPLKQVEPPKPLSFYNGVSPYARKTVLPEATAKSSRITVPGERHLEYSRDQNVTLEGYSPQEVAKLREEMQITIKPEVLEGIRKLQAKREAKKNEKSKEEALLSKITALCKQPEETVPLTEESVHGSPSTTGSEDLSFLPVQPSSTLLHMDKLELDKLEWMRAVDAKAEETTSLSVRFHLDGRVIDPRDPPDLPAEGADFDPFADSLRHHGEEGGRDGYTITELFTLARSAFPQQRHLAVSCLTRVLLRSHRLQHAHHFNVPTATQSLVDSGVVFLARWLVDDADLREAALVDALKLLVAVVAPDGDLGDRLPGDWPIGARPISLVARSSLSAAAKRRSLPPSERTEAPDEELVAEDVVSFLVTRGHLLRRLSWVMGALETPSPTLDSLVIGLLTRVAAHSLETAASLLKEPLLPGLVARRLGTKDGLCGPLLAMMAVLSRHSQSQCRQMCSLCPRLLPGLLEVLEAGLDSIEAPHVTQRRTLEAALDLLASMASLGVHLPALIELVPLAVPLLSALPGPSSSFLCALAPSLPAPLLPGLSLETPPSLVRLHTALYLRQRTSSALEAASSFYEAVVRPSLPSLPSLIVLADSHSVLGLAHRRPHLLPVRRDLPALLAFSPSLAVTTANPASVDRPPALLALHPAFSALSAASHALHALATSKTPPPADGALPAFLSCPDLPRLLGPLARSPPHLLAPAEPHSAIVQLEVEAVSALLLAVAASSRWADVPLASETGLLVHEAATALLAVMGPVPGLHRALLAEVVLCPRLLASRGLLADGLPALASAYLVAIPTATGEGEAALDDLAMPSSWPEAPLSSPETPQASRTALLTLWPALVPQRPPVAALVTLTQYLLQGPDWTTTDFLQEASPGRTAVADLLARLLADPALIDLSAKPSPLFSGSFFQLYDDLLNRYFVDSLSDTMLGNLVLFPCAMRFPVKYRRHLWSEFLGNVRLITVGLTESLLPLEEYLDPEETDSSLLRLYWRALRDGHVLPDRSGLLYWLCVHHLNRFIYRHAVEGTEARKTQTGLAKVICDPLWQQRHQWVRHVRLYKHFLHGDREALLYLDLPPSRLRHLHRIFIL